MLDPQNHFYILEDHFSSAISLKQHIFEEGFIAYIGGIKEAKFNVFLQRRHHQQPEQLISKVKDFFTQNTISGWVYVVPSQFNTISLQNALKDHDLVFDEVSTAMYCSLEPNAQSEIEPVNPLIIQSADVNRSGWLNVMLDAFGGTHESIQQYDQALNRAKAKNVDMQHFLGTLERRPVSTITLTFLNDGVKIDNVSTAPTHQRLGYSSQMVQFGMNLSFMKGFTHCVLDASSEGLSIYQRLGFHQIFAYHIYKHEAQTL